MTPPVRRSEPDELIQGDTWDWVIALDEFPASDGWALTYDFSGAGSLIFTAATDADGRSYDVTIPFGTTQALPAGVYKWNAYVQAASGAYAGKKYTVRFGTVRVAANFESAGPATQQAYAEKMLILVEGELQARLTNSGTTGSAHQAYSIEGRSISKIPVMELYTLRAKFANEIARLSRGGRLPPFAITFGRRPAGYPAGAGNRSGPGGAGRDLE